MDGINNINVGQAYPKNNSSQSAVSCSSTASIAPSFTQSPEAKSNEKPKIPIHLLILALLMPYAAMPINNFISKKLMKNDEDLKIDKKSVDRAIEYMRKENKLEEKALPVNFYTKGTQEADNLIKGFCGGAFSLPTKGNMGQIDVAEQRASAALHEMGHAINFNLTKLGKIHGNVLNKICNLSWLPNSMKSPLAIAGIAAFVPLIIYNLFNAKPKEENKNQKAFSVKKFFHDNLGLLGFGAFVPILADEATATYRAIKAAKKISPEIVKPLSKNLLITGSTYLIVAGVSTASVMLLRKFNDAIMLRKQKQAEIKGLQ